jgi:hypothetical protein
MSYSVTLYGHKDFETAEETDAFELDVIDRVKAFAESLPGLGGGTINTQSQEQVVLQASDGTATAPDGSPIVPADARAETETDAPDVARETDDDFRSHVETTLDSLSEAVNTLTESLKTLAGNAAGDAAKGNKTPSA